MGSHKEPATQNVFGAYLRAARLGFHWSSAHQRFLRMGALPGDEFEVEAVTRDGLFSTNAVDRRKDFYVWWEGNTAEILGACQPLTDLCEHPELHTATYDRWIVDMNGEKIA